MLETPFTQTINGQAVPATATFDVINPATEEVLAQAPNCSKAELDEAVQSARAAFPAWKALGMEKRSEYLLKMAGAMAANAEELGRLLTKEQGKPFEDAYGEALGGAHWLSEATKMKLPEHVNEDTDERRAVTRYDPIGVVAAVVPWNFPIILAMFKLAPALLAGNTVVFKPAPTTPLASLRIGEIFREILPAGVLNVISGDDTLGPLLTVHEGIDKVSFTGSTEVGRKVMEGAAASLKRVTLELGGNDAAIVMPDVDVDAVAERLFWAAFKNSGQICIASKRMYIHKDIYEPLKEAIVKYAKSVKIGDGSEQGTQIGPLQNERQYQRVLDLIADAKAAGQNLLVGGDEMDQPGYFIPITIVDNPPEDARIVQEEQFGPILPLLKFDNLDEVIERANASEYGLGASIWSADIARAEALAKDLEVGTVWINESQYLSPLVAFGGAKQSGIGVEGSLEGLMEFTQAKTVFTSKASVGKVSA